MAPIRKQKGLPSTGRILCTSCSQLNIKSRWGSHDLCHICRGYCNVAQFDHVITLKSWKIDISFSAGKQLLQQNPFPETHCENPEAEPYVGRDGIGKAVSLKRSSCRHEWQHLILGGRKCFIGPGQIWRWTSFAADLQESQRMAPSRK